jgi:LPS export ABC transporter permease LptG
MRVADRYVTRELIPPFILGVGGFLVILIGDILYTLAEYIALGRVTIDTFIRLLAYKMPAIMVVTFPVSTLFGTLIGMTRLARDREIQALRLAGVAVSRIFLPVVVFGVVIAAGTFVTNEVVAPWANHNANLVIRRALFGEAFPEVRQQVFLRAPGNRFLYVHTVDDRARVLRSVMIYEADRALPRLITAREATWSDKTWILRHGVARELDADGFTTIEAGFESMELNVGLTESTFFDGQKTPEEMTARELRRQAEVFGAGLSPRVPLEYYRKFSIPIASVVFAIIAAPLSLIGARGGQAVGVGMTIALLFVYYAVMSTARALGASGALSPIVAAWAPNILFAAVGIVLIVREEGWLRLRPQLVRRIRVEGAGS